MKMDDTRPSLLFTPACHVCGKRAVTLEIIPPGALPQEWDDWNAQSQQIFRERRKPDDYVLIYRGIAAGNGGAGTPKSEREAREIVEALVPEFRVEAIHEHLYDDLGYCAACGVFYCYEHWSPSTIGYGHCPRGHGKSLDPLWSPD
jgi:hypothetical protein